MTGSITFHRNFYWKCKTCFVIRKPMCISGELRGCFGVLDLLYNRLSFKISLLTNIGWLQWKTNKKRYPKSKTSCSISGYWVWWLFCQKMSTSFPFCVFEMEYLWGNFSEKFDPWPIMPLTWSQNFLDIFPKTFT